MNTMKDSVSFNVKSTTSTPASTPEGFNAAVIHEKGGSFRIERIRINSMQDDEIRVRVVASGLCHTEIVARDQTYPVPHPIVLGHEGSGIVEAVGKMVTKVATGDHVVMSFHSCGTCPSCQEGMTANCELFWEYNFAGDRPHDHSHSISFENGQLVNDRFFGQSALAQLAIVNEKKRCKNPEGCTTGVDGTFGLWYSNRGSRCNHFTKCETRN